MYHVIWKKRESTRKVKAVWIMIDNGYKKKHSSLGHVNRL